MYKQRKENTYVSGDFRKTHYFPEICLNCEGSMNTNREIKGKNLIYQSDHARNSIPNIIREEYSIRNFFRSSKISALPKFKGRGKLKDKTKNRYHQTDHPQLNTTFLT